MRMIVLRRFFCFFLMCVGLAPALTFAAGLKPSSDFNADTVSDITLVSIQNDQSLSWNVYSGSDASLISQRASLGKVGDNIISGNWLSASGATLGYVSVTGSSVSWIVVNKKGTLTSKAFGTKDDRFLSGADFNGDGIADAAIVRTDSKGNYVWTIKQDFFASHSTRLSALRRENRAAKAKRKQLGRTLADISIRFGSGSDVPFFVNPDSKGDVLALLRKDAASGNYTLLLRNPFTKKVRKIALGTEPTGTGTPIPVAQSNGADILALRTGDTNLKFMNLGGQLLGQTTLPGSGELLVGNFNELPGQELALQTGLGFSIYNPNNLSDIRAITLPSGIAIDDLNITKFSLSGGGGGGTGGGGSGGGNSGPGCTAPGKTPPSELASVCSILFPMNNCVLYKPGSGGTSDSRTGKPAFLWYYPQDNPHVNNLDVFASNGSKIAQFGLYTPAQVPMVRFYSGYGEGSGYSGPQLASLANAASGKPWLYFLSANGRCWGPITNPNGRSGGR